MSRVLVVCCTALLFIVGFAFLTVGAVAEQGLTAAQALSRSSILVLLGVGIIGALRNPPR